MDIENESGENVPAEDSLANPTQAAIRMMSESLGALHPRAFAERCGSIDDLIGAIIEEEGETSKAKGVEAVNEMHKSFSDWNEVRVTRMAELARCLDRYGKGDALAKRVREALSRIFDRAGCISLAYLGEMKASEAKRALMEIEPVSREVAAKILAREAPDSAPALSDEALALAKRLKIIQGNGTTQHLYKAATDAFASRIDLARFYAFLEAHAVSKCVKAKCPVCRNV